MIVLLTAACTGDGPTDPVEEPTVEQTIDITNVFAAAPASTPPVAGAMPSNGLSSAVASVDIRKIRITVYRDPGTTVLFQETYDVDPTQASWRLPFTAPVGATVRIVAELMSVTAGVPTVEYSGQTAPVVITGCTTGCAPIPIPVFPGTVENLGVTSVAVTPAAHALVAGETVQLGGAAAPAGPSYEYVWKSLDAAIATVSTTGLVTGVSAGTARVVVAVGPRQDTAVITVGAAVRTLTATAGSDQTAVAGSAVATPPSVTLVMTTSGGTAPAAGASIIFEVVAGSGTMTGGTATTNAQGVATVGSWTLGTQAGANILRARTADGLLEVIFDATAIAGAPAAMAAHAGNGQLAPAGSAVPVAPSVVIRDAHGNPVPGAAVTFEITTGGGALTGPAAVTNEQGIAVVGSWTFGPVAGTQTMTARSGTLSFPIDGVATVVSTCSTNAYTIGGTVNGAWADGDCLAASGSGRRYDMYEFTITEQTAFRAQVTGPNGRRVSLRRSGTEEYVQLMAGETFMPPTSNPLQVRYVLAPGSYVFEVANPDAATLGDYTLATSLDATTSCNPLVFVTLGVTINEELSAADCNGAFGGKEDWFILLPNIGQRVDLTLESTQIAPVLAFRDDRLGPASPTLTSDIRFDVGETARTAYTTTFTGFHEIVVNNASAELGAYTLTIGSGDPADTCVASPTTVGGRKLAIWETTDCKAGTDIYDAYPLTLATQTAFRTVLTSTAAPKQIGLFEDGAEVLEWIRNTAGDLAVNWFVAPGEYELRSKAPLASAGTSYTMAVTALSGDLGCATNATTGNVTFSNQTLGGSDCVFENWYEDRVTVLVQAGQQIVATMDGAFAPNVIIRDPASAPGTVLIMTPRATPGSTSATWTAATTGYYQVIFGSNAPGGTGAYSGSIAVN